MKKINRHGSKYVLVYDLWLFLERDRVSVVVATASRQTAFMYVRTMHGNSGCKYIQTDRVYVRTCDSWGSTHPCRNSR